MKIVLVNPKIPQNTGSIARTCAATKIPLAIVGETPFEISDKTVRRAGLDYWPYVTLERYTDWQDFEDNNKSIGKIWLLSKFGRTHHFDVEYGPNDILVFGSETKGLPDEIVSKYETNQLLRIPMFEENVRSLNLSNAVSIVAYEAIRQNISVMS